MSFFKNVYSGIKKTKSKIDEFAEKQRNLQDARLEDKLKRLEHDEKRLKLRQQVQNKQLKVNRLRNQTNPFGESIFFNSPKQETQQRQKKRKPKKIFYY